MPTGSHWMLECAKKSEIFCFLEIPLFTHINFILCSLRAVYGTDTRMNAVHASDSKETASRELAFFLPKLKIPYVPGTEPPIERTLALIRPHALAEHRGIYIINIGYNYIELEVP